MTEHKVLTGYGDNRRDNPNYAIALMMSNTVKDRFVPAKPAPIQNKAKDKGGRDES